MASVDFSIIIPCFNEEQNLAPLMARINPVLDALSSTCEVIFINDGSSDDTLQTLKALVENHALAASRVRIISLSRNFGKEIAIAAGLDFCEGAAAIIMDADLQHPPECIPEFLRLWRMGYHNVYGVRKDRATDSKMRQRFSEKFYQLFAVFGEIQLPQGAGDFRLLDRACVEALRAMGERVRFSKGLYAWIGFKSTGVPYDVSERAFGQSKFSFIKLTGFALDGLMSFSTIPLRFWGLLGFVISAISIAVGTFYMVRTLLFGVDVPGFASIIVSVLMLSGIQLLSLGVLGEYIGRIFAEVKGRPLYLVAEHVEMSAQGVRHRLSPLPKRWPDYPQAVVFPVPDGSAQE